MCSDDPVRVGKLGKKLGLAITHREDFDVKRESEVIKALYETQIVTKDQFDFLKESLVWRNKAAHPSDVPVTRLNAEHILTNLVREVILKCK